MSDLADMLASANEQGYKDGRADAFHEIITEMCKSPFADEKLSLVKKYIQEQLKEQSNE